MCSILYTRDKLYIYIFAIISDDDDIGDPCTIIDEDASTCATNLICLNNVCKCPTSDIEHQDQCCECTISQQQTSTNLRCLVFPSSSQPGLYVFTVSNWYIYLI